MNGCIQCRAFKKKNYQRKLWNEKLLAPAGHTQVNKLNAIKCWPYSLFVLIFKRVKDGVRVSNPSANRYLVKKEKKRDFVAYETDDGAERFRGGSLKGEPD